MAEATKSTNDYLSEMKRLQNEAIDALLEQQEQQKNHIKNQADKLQKQTNRAAAIDYMDYINPYGVQSESLADAGLSYSGVAEMNYGKGYNAYQSALSNAAGNAAQTKDQANLTYLGAQAQASANRLGAEADYYAGLYDNYWNQKQMDYYYDLLNESK